MSNKI